MKRRISKFLRINSAENLDFNLLKDLSRFSELALSLPKR
jgi:hypothetical protein